MNRYSATIRLTIGLTCLTVTVLLLAETFGLLPDPRGKVLEGRAALCETMAVHCTLLARRGELSKIDAMLQALAARNPDILSAGLRDPGGAIVVGVGEHARHWHGIARGSASDTEVYVPILSDGQSWGTLELRFRPLSAGGLAGWLQAPLTKLAAFVGVVGAVVYFFYLRKMLQHLDPSNVIPERVRQTLDTLAEGLLVLDRDERIVLANQAFAQSLGRSALELQGVHASNLPWRQAADKGPVQPDYPWARSMQHSSATTGVMLGLNSEQSEKTFIVNSAPIVGEDGRCRGVLASFGDVTLLEQNKAELVRMLETLKQSREEIHRQNEELQLLATRDPLTGCLNRRAFFGQFDTQWGASQRYGHSVSCVMVDVDHFKSINDRYGHAVGDQVLAKVGQTLKNCVRDGDLVCRYGGEEFCVLLPHLDKEAARRAAERYRRAVQAAEFADFSITVSVGVSASSFGAQDPKELLDQADQALYAAKRAGRNRTISWDEMPKDLPADCANRVQGRPEDQTATSIPFHAVTALVSALSYRDSATAEHSRRVADLCVATANGLMSVSDAYVLEIAALLHDLGKIGVPDSILLKPASLTPDEWKLMRVHDRIGGEIIRSTFADKELAETVLSHQAWYGGRQEDRALPSGKDIPLGARILAIADAYDAMVSDRVYRKAISQEQAFAELRRCSGTQFDPELVERFIETVKARDANRHSDLTGVSNHTALKIGLQIERLAQLVDAKDISGMVALAGRLRATAEKSDVPEIARIAEQLQVSATNDPELKTLVELTNELLELCRSTQRTYLDDPVELPEAGPQGREEAAGDARTQLPAAV
jgi:diguanylate cyclase (GGDEF)-like protein/PAS domain S-box-containing protein